jgi:hypothetical protein
MALSQFFDAPALLGTGFEVFVYPKVLNDTLNAGGAGVNSSAIAAGRDEKNLHWQCALALNGVRLAQGAVPIPHARERIRIATSIEHDQAQRLNNSQ